MRFYACHNTNVRYIFIMKQTQDAIWTVWFSAKAGKQKTKLPANIDDRLAILVKELIVEGTIQPEWKNYGKLSGKKG